MSLERLFELEGQWKGNYKLWFSPEDPPVVECATTAGIKHGVRDTCVKIAYDWVYEEKDQEGLIICAFNPAKELVRAAWFDSFHMANSFMDCEGSSDEGVINMTGSYSVSVGPAWRWRTILDSPDDGGFRIRMYNIQPDGSEDKAVEAVYSKG